MWFRTESLTSKCDLLDCSAASSWSWSSDPFLFEGNWEGANVLCVGSSFHRLFNWQNQCRDCSKGLCGCSRESSATNKPVIFCDSIRWVSSFLFQAVTFQIFTNVGSWTKTGKLTGANAARWSPMITIFQFVFVLWLRLFWRLRWFVLCSLSAMKLSSLLDKKITNGGLILSCWHKTEHKARCV